MKKLERVYFVIDMKCFFASVECAERGLDPFGVNLIVADESRGEGTVCLAISPKMKSLGVKNRCRVYEIPKNIDYIVAKPRMQKYIDYASEIYGIYLKYIDKNDIYVYSIDEAFIDVTDYLKMYNLKAKEFALKLMAEIDNTLHIPCTIGIGSNMYLAKIALDISAKHSPDRIGWLNGEKFKRTLWDHTPITDFWGISHGISTRLAKMGVFNMHGIALAKPERLYKEFGVNAELLIDHAYGIEPCTIADIKNYKRKSESISNSQILPKNYDFASALLVLKEMVQNACYRLAKEDLVTNHVHIMVGYGDNRYDGAKASATLDVTTNLYSIICPASERLYHKVVDASRPIRKVGISFGDLHGEDYEQYNFFVDAEEVKKEKNLVKSVLDIKEKFGVSAILKGIDLEEGATQIERNKLIGGHNAT